MAQPGSAPPDDPLGAFCTENHAALDGAPSGPLHGLTFGAKDIFHIAGVRTGFGQPDWLRTHPPEDRSAVAVQNLVQAGAKMVGKTHCDELCYSITGENVHYGTPRNPKAPDRVPGGSSSGSASATAGGLVDFALGGDTAGSVRIPASYCGVFGMRPTHNGISPEGVMPLAPSFDVVAQAVVVRVRSRGGEVRSLLAVGGGAAGNRGRRRRAHEHDREHDPSQPSAHRRPPTSMGSR